jgi:hypothetical protein
MYIAVTEQELGEFSNGQGRRRKKGSKSFERGAAYLHF